MSTSQPNTTFDFGDQAKRLKFLRFLRDEARYTNEDIARASGYGLDTVKGWFSDNVDRQRVVKDRALQLIMANLNITPQAYLLAVNRQD